MLTTEFTMSMSDFVQAFQSRLAVCRALCDLSRQQSGLIVDENFDQLFDVLHSKQSLLEHLTAMLEEQAVLRAEWPRQRARLPAPVREQCERLLAETEEALSQLLAAESSSTSLLTAQRDATQRELQSLSVGRQAQLAYESRPSPSLSRLDFNS